MPANVIMLAALALPFILGGKKKPTAGSSTSPGTDPAARAALLELKGGLQYWRTALADSLFASWAGQSLARIGCPAELGAAECYELTTAPAVTSAAAAVLAASRGGLVVLANLACAQPLASSRRVAFVTAAGAQLAARDGSDWAVFAPSAVLFGGSPTSPGTTPTSPGTTIPVPTIPGVTPATTPTTPGTTTIPGTTIPVPSIPGVTVPGPTPGTTPTVPGTTIPVPTIDPSAPVDPVHQAAVELGAKADASPEALEEAADKLAEQGYATDAALLRARAAELRKAAMAKDVARGHSLFTIRAGDIPSKLAQYYTGDAQRFRDIPPLNTAMGMKVVHRGGGTFLEPWRGTIKLPLAWAVWSKPLPPVASGSAPSGTVVKNSDA